MDNAVFNSVYETILRRDTRYDGKYYVGIRSTGIFCRPSCRSRTPKPENVQVYGSIEEARRAGFRPCKRCRPDNPGQYGPDAEVAQQIIGLIETRFAENITLDLIATELNMSPYHLQRVFKRTTGSTPAKRLLMTRMETAKHMLAETDQTIADIASAVGFRSASHFSSVFLKEAGCPPGEYRENNARDSALIKEEVER